MSLSSLWNKAVTGYQAVRQDINRSALETVNERIKEAQEGYQTVLPWPAPMGMGETTGIMKVKLEPEAQAAVIAREEANRDRLQAMMKARSEKYGLRL